MPPPEPAKEDGIAKQLLEELSKTPYACSSLSEALATKQGNYVYRGVLAQPVCRPGSAPAGSVIIKHCTNTATPYQPFEESLLQSLAAFSPSTTGTAVVGVPRLYLFNRLANIQVLEDLTDTAWLRAALFSSTAETLLAQSSHAAIGRALGAWLRSFHAWSAAPAQAALRAHMWQHDPARKAKHDFTFGTLLAVLQNFPHLLRGHESTIRAVQDSAASALEKPSTGDGDGDDGWGLVHGDLWSGNILLPKSGWREAPRPDAPPNRVFVIDWEFAQFGHRSCDLGQLVGDLLERSVYDSRGTGVAAMQGVIEGYGGVSDDMAFRTAVYVGVHLVSWYSRRQLKGPRVVAPDVIAAGLAIGRNFVVKGWERDRAFFEGGALAPLFAKK
ncbi:kinase-like domain-containing protein [Lasiosphaeria ovina]|uniref:Kinase-like domain-containing protein n=1 Tax=Lasiosphaeria ovina TaxID=92902 RepID=A0AAE0NMD0_9PEZI|nr:kinase-like domain-containing protein [Lasiosphaeria ovina]